jgi:osmotically inducible protein OsmC
MPRIERVAEVSWEGNVARGGGALTAASSGAFTELPYSLATRVGSPEGKTSPEELLAAAHGGCFTMSLATELSEGGTPPERLDVRVLVVMDEVAGVGHRVVSSYLDVRGRVPGIDAAGFARATEAADAGCPFSALVRASATVTVEQALEAG